MLHALDLAKRGFSNVEPNPMVGCLILKDNQVIAQGWHKNFGGPHAEINALNDCREKSLDPAGSTMLVTLEPCCHHGKTPPCTQAIIDAKIKKVIIAMTDPSEKVAGKGIRQLRDAGIKVTTGTCEKQARLLNPAFIKFSKTNLPWTILKWAQTIDAKLAGSTPSQRYITSEPALKDVHKTRRSAQAILVGLNTVINDDPLLTPRPAKDRKPLRIVLDNELKIPLESKILHTPDLAPTIIDTTTTSAQNNPDIVTKLKQKSAQILTLPPDEDNHCSLSDILSHLGQLNIQRLIVEGGPTVLTSFLKQNLADELNIYIAPKIYASTGRADLAAALTQTIPNLTFTHHQTQLFNPDTKITTYLNLP